MKPKPLVVVSGALANKPFNGGNAWSRLSWVLGFKAFGTDVLFVEQIRSRDCVDSRGTPSDFRGSVNRAYFEDVMNRFGLGDRSALVCDDSRETAGLPFASLLERMRNAEVLFNLSGHLTLPELRGVPNCRIFYDDDPGFTQFWQAAGTAGVNLAGHDHYFTIGSNIGGLDCPIPTNGIAWKHTRPLVTLKDWPIADPAPGSLAGGNGNGMPDWMRFTTVASWRGAYAPVQIGGRTYCVKAHEFRKFITLPRHLGRCFEIALQIHPGDRRDREALQEQGWILRDPVEMAGTPDAFRRYVEGSRAEFSVAQGIYVETNSGWFSDRTVRYLASGRPALVQDTGFSRHVPVGRGLLTFRTLDEAIEGAARIAADYRAHSEAARAVAEEFFDSNKVIGDLARAAGLNCLRARSPSGPLAPAAHQTRFGSERAARGNRRAATIIVTGMISARPWQGGATWAVLQYLLGLLRLGHDVYFIEPVGDADLQPAGTSLAASANARYLRRVAAEHGLTGRVSILRTGSTDSVGLPYHQLLEIARRSDLLLNISGLLTDPGLFEAIPVRVYLDLDPAFNQFWSSIQGIDMRHGGHTHFVTIGWNIGDGDCLVPTCGLPWLHTFQPVVLYHWPVADRIIHDGLTTVAHWRAYGSIEHEGVLYGQKAHSLRPFFPLPRRADDRFLPALSIHPAEVRDLAEFQANGWQILNPDNVASTPSKYRRFIQGSRAEFGFAKSGYVHSRCGWFSDRSICYLASGRPVIAQETGFSRHLPVGEGLFAYTEIEDVVRCVEALRADYPRHCRAARAIAEEHFDSDRVLRRLLQMVGI